MTYEGHGGEEVQGDGVWSPLPTLLGVQLCSSQVLTARHCKTFAWKRTLFGVPFVCEESDLRKLGQFLFEDSEPGGFEEPQSKGQAWSICLAQGADIRALKWALEWA